MISLAYYTEVERLFCIQVDGH